MNKFLVSALLLAFLALGSAECFAPNCDQCVADDPTKCEKCQLGFFVTSTKDCKNCVSHCELCSTSTNCDRCEKDYTRKTSLIGVKCVVENCGVSHCSECQSEDATKCKTCEAYFSLNANTLQCEPEICGVEGCAKCVAGNTNQCQECSEGFYRNSEGKCNKCLNHCSRCTMSSKCDRCEENYMLQKSLLGDKCLVVDCQVTFCERCEDTEAEKCATCTAGTYLDATDSKCYHCSENCASCAGNEYNCTSCNEYYQLDTSTNKCEAEICQVDNCAKCVAGNINQCKVCADGFYRNSEGKCANCLPHCSFCQMSGVCDRCEENYDLKKSIFGDSCTVRNCKVENCTKCQDTEANRCDTCADQNYLAADGQCYSCSDSCIGCVGAEKNCTVCAEYFQRNTDTNECEPEVCQVQGCAKCVAGDTTQCLQCADGFFRNSEKKCASCLPHCKTCETSYRCIACEDFYAVKKGIFYNDACVVKDCQVKYCSKCQEDDANKCDTCNEHYSPNGDATKCEFHM